MPPITWQNVNGQDATTTWRALDSSQRSFNGAFDGLQKVLENRQSLAAENFATGKTNATNEDLAALSQFKTAADYQAAVKSGAVASILGRHGAGADQAKLLAFDDARQGVLQGRDVATIGYNNTVTDNATQPLEQQLKAAIYNKDPIEQARLTGLIAAAGGRHQGDSAALADQFKQTLVDRSQQTGTYDRQGVRQTADITHMVNTDKVAQGMLGVAQGNLGVNQGELGLHRDQLAMTKQDRLDQRLATAVEGLGKARSNEAGSAEGTQAVFTQIASTFKGDSNGDANARRAFGQILKANPNISTADALSAILTQDNSRWYKLDSVVRSNTEDRAADFAGTDESKARSLSNALSRSAAQELYKNARTAQLAGPGAVVSTSGGRISPAASIKTPLPTAAEQDQLMQALDARAQKRFGAGAPEGPSAAIPTVQGSSSTEQAVKGLDAALTQTGQAMAKANAAGNAQELRRLQALFIEQNKAKQAITGDN